MLYIITDPNIPMLVVSTEVTQGYLPVLNTTVRATALFQDAEGEEISAYSETTINLLDDGVGEECIFLFCCLLIPSLFLSNPFKAHLCDNMTLSCGAKATIHQITF